MNKDLWKSWLGELETRLQQIVEGGALRLFNQNGDFNDLARLMVQALEQGLKPVSGGTMVAPNLFVLFLHPTQADRLRTHPELLDELSLALVNAVQHNSARLVGALSIQLIKTTELPLRSIQVKASISPETISQTSNMTPDEGLGPVSIPKNAFLIVNGTQTLPLTRPVINIGRRPDNHLVIDDSRVSRLHAQLRAVHGRYLIFDLDSTGGTFVNEQRVRQSVLYTGDVVSLAGVPLVYGEDNDLPGETQRLDPLSGDH